MNEGIRHGCLALCACILYDITPDKAIGALVQKEHTDKGRARYPAKDAETEEAIRMLDTMTYVQVGEIFGVKPGTLHRRIKRYLERKKGRNPGWSPAETATNTSSRQGLSMHRG